MSAISVVGLGLMGSALARRLLAGGYAVSAWNRDANKSRALVGAGAVAAESLAAAVAASPNILVCVRDYETTRDLFSADAVRAGLEGKILIQLSTGMPREAVAAEAWFNDCGAAYLDGAILASPADIGGDAAQILIAGDEAAWQRSAALIECLAADTQYTGRRIDSAAILDLAWLGQRLGLYMGVFQALELCRAGGVGADVYAATIAPDERMQEIAKSVGEQIFDQPINTVKVWHEALLKVMQQARESGANAELLKFVDERFARAVAAGHAELDMAALIRAFEPGAE